MEYTHDDVIQALACLELLSESDMASAAAALWADHAAGRDSDFGWVSGDVAHIVGGPCDVCLSLAALWLLAVSFRDAPARGIALHSVGGRLFFDMRAPEVA